MNGWFKALLAAIAVGIFGALLASAWERIEYRSLTGSWNPIRIVEKLDAPVAVEGWTERGLKLEDGRFVPLPELEKLPISSAALKEATQRGVEIAPNGRVYGLVRIHHWCGNDPVEEHLARVDISKMLQFLQEGEPLKPTPSNTPPFSEPEPGGQFSKWGWNDGEYYAFDRLCR